MNRICKYLLLVLLILITSCKNNDVRDLQNEPFPSIRMTAIPTTSISEVQGTEPGLKATSTLQIPAATVTPLPRIISAANCQDNVSGQIFFLHSNQEIGRNYASQYDLYVMDGNGCFPRFVMPEASGSPDWSRDGKWLAVGCENNDFLCILDVQETLDSCSDMVENIGKCYPTISQKIPLPMVMSGQNEMYNLQWSSDGSQIAAEGGDRSLGYYVYLLTLSDENNEWEQILQNNAPLNFSWSPQGNEIVFTGLTFLNLRNINAAVSGDYPEWSPDGRRVAYRSQSFDNSLEPWGIAIVDIHNNEWGWDWLYEPQKRETNYSGSWPNDIIISNTYYNNSCLLSWSPDQRYIAFVADLYGTQSHIFRLDIENGEILNLTANLELLDSYFKRYYAPAWGP